LDVRDGRVVKGVRFQGLRDAGDPAALAAAYDAQGADEIVALDVAATPEGRGASLATVRAVHAAVSVPLTVGGGVRDADDVRALLQAGADKVAVNTAAVDDPELVGRLAEEFGRQCIVLAVDAARRGDGWEVVAESGTRKTGADAVAWCQSMAEAGAGEVLLTSWDRDGTGDGYDLECLRAVCGAVGVPVIASGGAAGVAHMAQAFAAGAEAVLAASVFHDGAMTVLDVKRGLAAAGVEVRL
jgi:imidazoleglycerol phosphate synthase cyclase subunit